MSTALHHLSGDASGNVPDGAGLRFVLIVSDWNAEITGKLRDSACETLQRHGVRWEDISAVAVPGSFELIYAAKRLADAVRPDAVIGLGCVIRGETPHFDYVCAGVTQGFAALNAAGNIPYIFGLLTTDTLQQAEERAGGKYGNKGGECALTAIRMAKINCELRVTNDKL
jgi:6,7-dimethyl-8-ribityllumazine synthase